MLFYGCCMVPNSLRWLCDNIQLSKQQMCCTFCFAVSEETCNEVHGLVFDLFANLGATGEVLFFWIIERFHPRAYIFFVTISSLILQKNS